MNKKLKLLSIISLTLFVLIFTTCMAASGDNIVDLDSNNEGYITSYEDYEQLMNEQSTGYTQEQLKEDYELYQTSIHEYYNTYERDETVKAKVIKVYDVEEYYEYNEYYYSVSKYKYQPITVKVLEGQYIDQEFDIDYLLTGDSLNNITYSEVEKGDIIYVGFFVDEETGETYADITNAGSNVERKGIVIFLGIIAILLVIIYGGKKGVIASLIALLILYFCLIVIPNMGFAGEGFVFSGVLLTIACIVAISIMELGINTNTLKSILISAIMVLIATLLIFLFNYLTRTSGITFEVAAISENVLLGNMNFEHLYTIVTLIIATVFITNIVSKSIKKLSEVKKAKFNEKVNSCNAILGSNVLTLIAALFVTYIPNHLLLLTNKYTFSEIWNSEILISELIRVFVIIISMSLAIPMVAIFTEREEK